MSFLFMFIFIKQKIGFGSTEMKRIRADPGPDPQHWIETRRKLSIDFFSM